MKFEQQKREFEEQIFRLEEEQEIKSLQAELDCSLGGEASDSEKESESGSVDQNDEENLNFDAEKYHTIEFRFLTVSFPEERTSYAAPARSSFSERLNATGSQFSRIGTFENPFEHERRIASTLLATKGSRPISSFDPMTSRPMLSSGSTGFPHQQSILKLKLREFDGDALDLPDWSGMFLATIDSSSLNRDEIMGHFNSPLKSQKGSQ